MFFLQKLILTLKLQLSIAPLENLSQLMFPNRGIPKQAQSPPIEPLEMKTNPFIDLSTSAMESTLR